MTGQGILDRLSIDIAAPVERHHQLSQAIRRDIEGARLAPGERLPSVRSMCEASGLASATVVRALADLERDGLIVRRRGSGSYVAQRRRPATEVLIPEPTGGGPFNDAFLQQIVAGVRRGLGAPDHRCFLTHVHATEVHADEILDVCRVRRVGGLIAYRPSAPLVAALREAAGQMPTVALGRPQADLEVDGVYPDPTPALRELIRARVADGRRRFVFAGVQEPAASARPDGGPLYLRMLACVRETLREAGIEPTVYLAERAGTYADHDLAPFAAEIPDDATVVAAFPRLACTLERPGVTLDKIAYTEIGTNVDRYRDRVTVLYVGIDRCAARAAEMLAERIAGLDAPPRLEPLAPEVFQPHETEEGRP